MVGGLYSTVVEFGDGHIILQLLPLPSRQQPLPPTRHCVAYVTGLSMAGWTSRNRHSFFSINFFFSTKKHYQKWELIHGHDFYKGMTFHTCHSLNEIRPISTLATWAVNCRTLTALSSRNLLKHSIVSAEGLHTLVRHPQLKCERTRGRDDLLRCLGHNLAALVLVLRRLPAGRPRLRFDLFCVTD